MGHGLNNTALIYAEGGKSVGMGHLSRACLLRDYVSGVLGMPSEVAVRGDGLAIEFLSARGIKPVVIDGEPSGERPADGLGELLDSMRPSLLVIDRLDPLPLSGCVGDAKAAGIVTMAVLDNTERAEFCSDIVVNGNPSQLGVDYSCADGTYLAGPMYFIMDPAYASLEMPVPAEDAKRLLLTFGGSDHNDLAFKALDALRGIAGIHVTVASSSGSGYSGRLGDFMRGLPYPNKLVLDANGLTGLWCGHDIAVTAGGNTLFERVAARLPGATICQLVRQMEIADGFESLSVNRNLGYGPDLTSGRIADKVSEFIDDYADRVSQYDNAPKVVDGRGLERIGREIKALLDRRA